MRLNSIQKRNIVPINYLKIIIENLDKHIISIFLLTRNIEIIYTYNLF